MTALTGRVDAPLLPLALFAEAELEAADEVPEALVLVEFAVVAAAVVDWELVAAEVAAAFAAVAAAIWDLTSAEKVPVMPVILRR